MKIYLAFCKPERPGQLSRYSDLLRAGLSGDRIPVGARFSAPVQTGPGAHPASCTMGTGPFRGVKRPGRGADHPPYLSVEVLNWVGLGTLVAYTGKTFTSPFFCKPETLDCETSSRRSSVAFWMPFCLVTPPTPPKSLSLSYFIKKNYSCMYVTIMFCILVTKYGLRPQRPVMYSTYFLLLFFRVHFYNNSIY